MPLILLIEDDPMQRLAPTFTLQKAGFEVMQADTAEAGLDMALARKPDLIVCDVLMPGMSGFEFVAQVRRTDRISEVPIIMLTSLSERSHMRTGMTTGADDYLVKPLNVQELRDAVLSLLSKRKAQQDKLQDQMETELITALDQQRDSLSAQYERRLVEELNTRWVSQDGANTEVHYDTATVVLVDVLGSLPTTAQPGADVAAAVRQRVNNARDTLYLFGARHLVPYGNDMLALFAAEPGNPGTTPQMRALRAAFALVKAAGKVVEGQRSMTVAIHEGPMTLVEVSDALHGDPNSLVAAGEAVGVVAALMELARQRSWRVAVTASFGHTVHGAASEGAREPIPAAGGGPAYDAVELIALT